MLNDQLEAELLRDCEAHESDSVFKTKVTSTTGTHRNLEKAAAQFVSKTRAQIVAMVQETLEGHQRAIMAELTVDQIYKDRYVLILFGAVGGEALTTDHAV